MTINQTLKHAYEKIAPTDAEILLSFVLKKDKIFLYKNPDYKLTANDQRQFARFVTRRIAGEPIAYILNYQEFYGLDFYINKNVLIPRPGTELLVEEVIKRVKRDKGIRRNKGVIKIADVGTGSGCVAIAIATELRIMNQESRIFATDISEKALKIAKKNAQKHKVENGIIFLPGDLLAPLPEKMDIIVTNLPYIKSGKTVPRFEPSNSLYAGEDGLDLIKKLLEQAPKYLKKSGVIFLEISPEQKTTLQNFILEKLLPLRGKFKKDLQGLYRLLIIKI